MGGFNGFYFKLPCLPLGFKPLGFTRFDFIFSGLRSGKGGSRHEVRGGRNPPIGTVHTSTPPVRPQCEHAEEDQVKR